MPGKRPQADATPAEDDRQDKGNRKNVSGSGSRSAFNEMRRRAREVPSPDPAGALDEPPRPQDQPPEDQGAVQGKPDPNP